MTRGIGVESGSLMRTESAPGSTRCAVWYGAGDLRVEERPLPPMGDSDVLIDVVSCGVCGSDLHIVTGESKAYTPPCVIGHEGVGIVQAVGRGVNTVRPGEQVSWDIVSYCGVCFACREGEEALCERAVIHSGAFAERVVMPQRSVFRLPANVPLRVGILAEPLSAALHAFDRAGVRLGDRIAIIGGGTIGLLLLVLARRAGAGLIVLSEPNSTKRALAHELGADVVVNPLVDDVEDLSRSVTAGRGVEVAFEAVGTSSTVSQALALARRGGTVMLAGVASPAAEVMVRPYDLFRRDLSIRASYMRNFTFQRAVDLLPQLPLDRLVTHEVALDDVNEALALLRAGEAIKVVVRP